jgi:hypothetical protein
MNAAAAPMTSNPAFAARNASGFPRSNRNLVRDGVSYRLIRGPSMTAAVIAAYHQNRSSMALDGLLAAARETARHELKR